MQLRGKLYVERREQGREHWVDEKLLQDLTRALHVAGPRSELYQQKKTAGTWRTEIARGIRSADGVVRAPTSPELGTHIQDGKDKKREQALRPSLKKHNVHQGDRRVTAPAWARRELRRGSSEKRFENKQKIRESVTSHRRTA